jgi:hypothetical protein
MINGDNSNIINSNMNMPDTIFGPNSDMHMTNNTTAATAIPIRNVNNNSNNNNASSHHAALLQQNFAIMQQNAKALQHLQQTNIFLAANPTAATTTILALNPTLLAPPIGCAAIGATSINNNPIISTISNDDNINKNRNIDVNITESAAITEQQQQQQQSSEKQQHQSTPLISTGGAPLGDETSQLQADGDTTNSTNINNIISDNNDNNNNNNINTANILRSAMMLRNNMDSKNSNNNGIIVEGNGDGDGAIAAANAAASVLPSAIMNMNDNNMLSSSLSPSFPMIGENPNILNYKNNTIIFGNNNHNISHNNFYNSAAAAAAVAASMNSGLISLRQQQQQQQTLQQQQQQQHVLSMVHLQQHQHQPPLSPSNSVDISFDQKQQKQQQQKQKSKPLLSRPLYLEHDSICLTTYQCFLRKQIELFEAGFEELNGTAQGRNTPLKYGQVGIRCRHCSHLPKPLRARGGVYFSRTIDGVYQVSQNMSKIHFLQACTLVPEHTKNQLKSLQSVSSRASGGKEYWAEGLRVLGIVEEGGMLRFASNCTVNEDDDH